MDNTAVSHLNPADRKRLIKYLILEKVDKDIATNTVDYFNKEPFHRHVEDDKVALCVFFNTLRALQVNELVQKAVRQTLKVIFDDAAIVWADSRLYSEWEIPIQLRFAERLEIVRKARAFDSMTTQAAFHSTFLFVSSKVWKKHPYLMGEAMKLRIESGFYGRISALVSVEIREKYMQEKRRVQPALTVQLRDRITVDVTSKISSAKAAKSIVENVCGCLPGKNEAEIRRAVDKKVEDFILKKPNISAHVGMKGAPSGSAAGPRREPIEYTVTQSVIGMSPQSRQDYVNELSGLGVSPPVASHHIDVEIAHGAQTYGKSLDSLQFNNQVRKNTALRVLMDFGVERSLQHRLLSALFDWSKK